MVNTGGGWINLRPAGNLPGAVNCVAVAGRPAECAEIGTRITDQTCWCRPKGVTEIIGRIRACLSRDLAGSVNAPSEALTEAEGAQVSTGVADESGRRRPKGVEFAGGRPTPTGDLAADVDRV